jgi:hypothetical protein
VTDSQTLRAAIKQARKAGLPQEFRDGYRRYRAEGDSVSLACWAALYDWDMLDVVEDARLGVVLTFGEKG